MAYSFPSYAKQCQSFREAVQLLLDAEDGFHTEQFTIDVVNRIDRFSDEVVITFSGEISPDMVRQLNAILLAPYDDDRLDAIAREFPDTLYLKDS